MNWFVSNKSSRRSSSVDQMSLTRRLFTGTVYLTISNGIVRLLSIITLPILTSLLSPRAYGIATLAGTVISIGSVIALAGIDMSYARTYHSAQPPNGIIAEHFCWRFAILAGLIAAPISGIAWWILTKHSRELEGWLGILLGLGVLISIANTMSMTRTRLAGQYLRLSLAIVVSGSVTAVVTIGIATWRHDAIPKMQIRLQKPIPAGHSRVIVLPYSCPSMFQ